jgi:hypothetical protein
MCNLQQNNDTDRTKEWGQNSKTEERLSFTQYCNSLVWNHVKWINSHFDFDVTYLSDL